MSSNNSITHAVLANAQVPDQEAATFLATNEWRYFETHWRPLLPARVWTVLSCLYDHVRFDKKTWQKREECWPSYEELAARAHMNARTVRRILHRDDGGHFTYAYRGQVYWLATEGDVTRYVAHKDQERTKERQRRQTQADDATTASRDTATATRKPISCPFQPGHLIAGAPEEIPADYDGQVLTLGDLISLFVKSVQERYHYNQQACQWQRTSNLYTVSAIVPPVPDIASQNAILITLADVRAKRQQMQEETTASAAPPHKGTRTKWPVRSPDKMDQEPITPKPRTGVDDPRSAEKGVVPSAIRKTQGQDARTPDEANQEPGNDAGSVATSSLTLQPLHLACVNEGAPASAIATGGELTERELKLADAWASAGGVVWSIVEQTDVTDVEKATAQILGAFVDQGVPAEQMAPLADLARARVNKRTCNDNLDPLASTAAYYIGAICGKFDTTGDLLFEGIAREARRRHYDVAKMRAGDAARYAASLRAAQKRRNQQQGMPAAAPPRRPGDATRAAFALMDATQRRGQGR